MTSKILIVLTSHGTLGSTGKPTGWYLAELAHPWDVFNQAGATIHFASPKGGAAPLDPNSTKDLDKDLGSKHFLEARSTLWENTRSLSEFVGKADEYDAIFFPGGHGPMFDLATDKTSIQVVEEFAKAGKIVGAVCHGPAALVNAKGPDGKALLAGKKVTGFTNKGEDSVGLSEYMPFMLETKLNEVSGGKFDGTNEPWGECVVVDGKVITGMNPASAKKIGEEIIKAIKA